VKAAVAVSGPPNLFTLPMAVDLERRGDVRLLIIAVQNDTYIHPSPSCRLARAICGESHYVLTGGAYSSSAALPSGADIAGCSDGDLTWTGGAPDWNKRAIFLLYANPPSVEGHFLLRYRPNRNISDFLQASFP